MSSFKTGVLILALSTGICAKRYAVLAGNAYGGRQHAMLKYVRNDLDEFQAILTEFCGFTSDDILTLYNKSPQDLATTLQQLAARLSTAEKDDLFLFYYSGHADKQRLMMGEQDFKLATLRTMLESSPARIRIAILDACQSGSVTRIKGGRLAEPFLFKEDEKIQGQVILYSSSETENSQESDAYKNSIFTFHFLNALRGCGDLSGDGRITLGEAYQYSYNNTIVSTVRSSGGTQHPGYEFKIQGEGDIILADVNKHTQGLFIPYEVSGLLTIFDEQNRIVADFAKEANSAYTIALTPGEYRIVTTRDNTKKSATVRIAKKRISLLKTNEFVAVAPVAPGAAKGADIRRYAHRLGVRGGVDFYDFSTHTSLLNQRFAGFALIKSAPVFTMPASWPLLSLRHEIALQHGMYVHVAGSITWHARSHASAGSYLAIGDSTEYATSLALDERYLFGIVESGPGIRISRGLLSNLGFCAGLKLYLVKATVSSTFSDSLFKISNQSVRKEAGPLLLPYLETSYELPAAGFMRAGIAIEYRFQADAQRLLNESSDEAFRYYFGGFGVSIYSMAVF
ncbi:MAG: hypothetical protein GF398_14560 [Chitinivibrionales bacterium]|nr:hypothetical protein [Chitinivibrionales bacterium]